MKFQYIGPASGLTLADGTEVLLWPGHSVELPPSDVTEALQAQGYLQPVAAEPPAKKTKEA